MRIELEVPELPTTFKGKKWAFQTRKWHATSTRDGSLVAAVVATLVDKEESGTGGRMDDKIKKLVERAKSKVRHWDGDAPSSGETGTQIVRDLAKLGAESDFDTENVQLRAELERLKEGERAADAEIERLRSQLSAFDGAVPVKGLPKPPEGTEVIYAKGQNSLDGDLGMNPGKTAWVSVTPSGPVSNMFHPFIARPVKPTLPKCPKCGHVIEDVSRG